MPKLTAWLGGGIGLLEQHWQQIPIRPWGHSAAGRMLCTKASSSHAGVGNLRGSLRQELLAPAERVGLCEEGQAGETTSPPLTRQCPSVDAGHQRNMDQLDTVESSEENVL